MSKDPLDYSALVQESLRSIARRALQIVAEEGLPGEHHFSISFATNHPGVVLSQSLRDSYPEEMPIILQHRFWNLEVDEEAFSVELSFNGVRQLIRVPFTALRAFVDPAAEFGLHFTLPEEEEETPPMEAEVVAAGVTEPEEPARGGKVVSLEDFRKN